VVPAILPTPPLPDGSAAIWGTGRSAIDADFVLLHIGTNDATQGATLALTTPGSTA
jgi:hypothetical protein